MKKLFFLFFFLFLAGAPGLFASSDKTSVPDVSSDMDLLKKEQPAKENQEDTKKPLKEDAFSVSTEDLDSSDSLNRVAGEYDRGYSSPEQSYQSKKGGLGPFAHEKAEMSDQSSQY